MGCCGKKEEKENNEPEKPGLLSRSPYYEIKNLISIGMTIACMYLAIDAYVKLLNYTSDVADILKNWKTKPVIDIYVANVSDSCADGYSEMSFPYSAFTGLGKGHCGCATNLYGYVSSYENCSDVAEASIECSSAPSLDGFSAKSWRRQRICYKRGGDASISFEDGYSRRPYPDNQGNCPEGYKLCGQGNYQNTSAVCFPDDQPCPITGLLITDTQPSAGSWIPAGNFSYFGVNLYYRREYPNELPAVNLEDALTKYKGDYKSDNYNGKENSRGPCYIGDAQKYSSDVAVSQLELVGYTLKGPKSCSKPDPRFVLYDNIDIADHYLGVIDHNSRCVGFELYQTDDPRYVAGKDPDYLQSGVPCGSYPYTCSRPSDMPTNCGSGDQICNLIVNQNTCGQYVQAIRGIGGKSDTFGLYRRSEIYWAPSCEVDREAIYTNKDPLNAALQSQLAVVVLGCLFGLFAGVFWPIALLTVLRKEFCNVVNYKVTIMDQADPWIHLLKMIPLIPSIYYVGKIYQLFATAGQEDCSDPTSNETFDFLATTLPDIFQKSISNIVIEGFMMLTGFYFLRQKIAKAKKVAKVAPEENANNSPEAPPPQQPAYQMVPPMQQPVYQMAPGGYPPQQPYGMPGYQMAPGGYPQQP